MIINVKESSFCHVIITLLLKINIMGLAYLIEVYLKFLFQKSSTDPACFRLHVFINFSINNFPW